MISPEKKSTTKMATNRAGQLQQIGRTVIGNTRILIYCSLILICSISSLSEDYKIEKSNLLNQWFVKIGWFWTISLLLPLLFITIRNDDKETVFTAILRLIMSTTIWYISVNLFQYIDGTTGFDISGHTFLLMFSNLIIFSELKLVEKELGTKEGGNKQDNNISESQHYLTIKKALLILTILWDFMLIQTALYYHTLIQKVLAASWAVGSWYVLHIFFYHKPQTPVASRGRGDLWTNEHMSVNS